MSHQVGCLRQSPRLHEVGLQLQELREWIAEHLLVLLVPFSATYHITRSQDITCLTHRGGPGDRTAIVERTIIGIGVRHLRHKLVAHRNLKIRMLRDDAIEGCRTRVHVLIRQYQRTERMMMLSRGRPIVGQFSRHHMATEVSGTVEHIHGSLHRTIVSTWVFSLTETALILRHRTEEIPRGDEAWENQGDIRTILIAIDMGSLGARLVDGLPLIRAMQVDVEFLATSKSIALGETDHQLRTDSSGSLALAIRLHIEVLWLVEHQVDLCIQGIAIHRTAISEMLLQCKLVARRKLDAAITEQAHRLEMTLRRLLVLYLLKAAWEEFQVFQDDTWSNRNLATIVEEAQLATNKGVFQFLIELLTEVELHVANIIAIVHHGVDAIRHHQAHLRLAWRAQGVCQIRGIAILVIIISIVAEKSGDALALLLQLGHIERIVLLDNRL